jgi:hypothetical protein
MKMECWRNLFLVILAGASFSAAAGVSLKLAESTDRLILLRPENWNTGEVEGRASLILHTAGEQRPPVRRPGEYALLNSDQPVSEFTIEAATLEPDATINRDICLIFGYRDDTHFYYAHVSSNSDNKVHNVIMRVDGESRARINLENDPEARLKKGWTTIKIQHTADGAIRVFVDAMETPLMTAKDTAYSPGKIGFGAFDDRAAFATLVVK